MVWNPNKTSWELQFDDLPLKKDVSLQIIGWYDSLRLNHGTTNNIVLRCVAINQFKLIDKDVVNKGDVFNLSVWSGIYTKWEKAKKSTTALQPNLPINIVLHKQSKRKWRIKEITQ